MYDHLTLGFVVKCSELHRYTDSTNYSTNMVINQVLKFGAQVTRRHWFSTKEPSDYDEGVSRTKLLHYSDREGSKA